LNSKLLKIAIQKKGGKLHKDSVEFLNSLGYRISDFSDKLSVRTYEKDAQIFFLRSGDIPAKIAQGIIDLGIVGANTVAGKYTKLKNEKALIQIDYAARNKIAIIENLEFGFCRLVLATPQNAKIKKIKDLTSKKIATSYPEIVKTFFSNSQIKNTKIILLSGSVEIAPESGEAEAIADLVETGKTLKMHNLREIKDIFKSQALLIANPKFAKSLQGKKVCAEIKMRLQAIQSASKKKYVMLNCTSKNLLKIEKILPSANAPTVLSLAKPDEFAVHSVLTEKEFWQILPQLKNAGARDILLLNIEKLIF
jgi:ATP phosphoribosyltransferase